MLEIKIDLLMTVAKELISLRADVVSVMIYLLGSRQRSLMLLLQISYLFATDTLYII